MTLICSQLKLEVYFVSLLSFFLSLLPALSLALPSSLPLFLFLLFIFSRDLEPAQLLTGSWIC